MAGGSNRLKTLNELTLCIWLMLFISCATRPHISQSDSSNSPIFEGIWEGSLNIYPRDQLPQSQVDMRLEVLALDSTTYSWTLQYGSGSEADIRSYELRIKDVRKGLYEIDEKNGIVLKMQQFDNQFISWFEVMGSQLVMTYTFLDPELLFEVRSMRPANYDITGDTIMGQDTIPLVKNYQSSVFQKAILKRTK